MPPSPVSLPTKRALVFDLDGTLIDSRGDIAAACNFTLRASGRPELSVDVISGYVGSGAKALLEGVLGEVVSQDELESLLQIFVGYYREHPVEFNRVLPGALEAIARGQGRLVALCTNKPAALTEVVLERLGWDSYFDAVVAPGPGDAKKPSPEPLVKVAAELGLPTRELIMIGDAPQDVGAGKAVGAYTVGLRGGFLPEERLVASKPDVILNSLLELPEHLKEAGI